VTLAAAATSMGIVLADATVSAESDLDFRGTLGVAKDAPVGFSAIRLAFALRSDEAPDKLRKLAELTERYCVVFQTLAVPPRIEVRIEGSTGALPGGPARAQDPPAGAGYCRSMKQRPCELRWPCVDCV
jgi:hypothetical protein